MFGRARHISSLAVATKLERAAELIREASAELDAVCCRATSATVDRVEAIPGLQNIHNATAEALEALAARLTAEHEAALEAAEAELADDLPLSFDTGARTFPLPVRTRL